MSGKNRLSFKLVVGDFEQAHSAAFKIWSSKNDVYIAANGLGGILKVSLHESGQRHRGFTRKYMMESIETGSWDRESRHLDMWNGGLELSPSLTLEYRFCFPQSQLRKFENDRLNKSTVTLIPGPPEGRQVQVSILLDRDFKSLEKWPGKNNMNTQLVGGKALTDGTFVWVVSHVTDNPPDFETKIATICKEVFENVRNLPNLPSSYGPQHRLLLSFKDDNDGVMGYYDIAGDNLNKLLPVQATNI